VRALEQQLGDSAVGPTPSELAARDAFRLSCVAAGDLRAGARLSARDLLLRRPGNGLPPSALDFLIGKRLSRDVRAGEPLSLEHLAA
jgi:sialic acid synthase SpsE